MQVICDDIDLQCKEKVSDCESDTEDHKNVELTGTRTIGKMGQRSSDGDVKGQPTSHTFVAVTNSSGTTLLPSNATPISILTPTSINKPKPIRQLPSDSSLNPVLSQVVPKLVFQPAGGAFRSVPSPKDPSKV